MEYNERLASARCQAPTQTLTTYIRAQLIRERSWDLISVNSFPTHATASFFFWKNNSGRACSFSFGRQAACWSAKLANRCMRPLIFQLAVTSGQRKVKKQMSILNCYNFLTMYLFFNFVYTDLFYVTRRTKLDTTCICFKEFYSKVAIYVD